MWENNYGKMVLLLMQCPFINYWQPLNVDSVKNRIIGSLIMQNTMILICALGSWYM